MNNLLQDLRLLDCCSRRRAPLFCFDLRRPISRRNERLRSIR